MGEASSVPSEKGKAGEGGVSSIPQREDDARDGNYSRKAPLESPTNPSAPGSGADRRHGGAEREGFGFGAFAVFRRVRDATRAIRRPLKPAANRLLIPLAALLVRAAIAAINRTVRLEIVGTRHDEPLLASGEPVIYAFFHSRLFSMFRVLRGREVAVLVALGDIGDVISSVARGFGHRPVRGARSAGAARALAEAIREVRAGRSAAFAVDGPRGPREIVKPGALYVAQKSGRALIPIVTASRWKWNLGIWDRHEIPHPFTRTVAVMGPPVRIARDAAREQIEAEVARLQETLARLREAAEAALRA